MDGTESGTMFTKQHKASKQFNNDRIGISPENRPVMQAMKKDATQAPTLADGSQSLRSCKRLAGDPGISDSHRRVLFEECSKELSSNKAVSTNDSE